MPNKPRLQVMVSLDVEEEGLFRGEYARTGVSVANVASLFALKPFLERGIRPTLFCAWSVFTDGTACAALERLRAQAPMEIGCHLHHWNTPPLAGDMRPLKRVPSRAVALEAFGAKLDTLLSAAQNFLGARPKSFRMGRWDLHAPHWQLLASRGILADASVRPLHVGFDGGAGPDHFLAPRDPYWIKTAQGEIFEAPLTAEPLFSFIPAMLTTGQAWRQSLPKWGALVLQPIYHPSWLLRLTTRLHAARGGKCLSLAWHSSEMMPGGAPHMPDRRAVDKFMAKMASYFSWLEKHYDVTYVTLLEMRALAGRPSRAAWCKARGDYGQELAYGA